MKKLTIFIYLILGGILFQITQAFIDNKVVANTSFFTTTKNKSNTEKDFTYADERSLELTKNKPNIQTDFTYAAEKSLEAVVHIKSKIMEDEYYRYYHPFFGQGYFNQPTEKVASGSGVIISEDGYVVTNKHVINEAEEIEVVLNDKRSYTAALLGTDPDTDLALLKINTQISLQPRFPSSHP